VLKMGVLSFPLIFGYLYVMLTIARIKFSINGHLRSGGIIFAAILFMLSLQDGSLASPLMIFTVIYVFLEAKAIFANGRLPKNLID
jgi:hypothetical protein